MTDDGIDEARKAKERAKEALKQVEAQRPEIDDVTETAIVLLRQNSFALLVWQPTPRSPA